MACLKVLANCAIHATVTKIVMGYTEHGGDQIARRVGGIGPNRKSAKASNNQIRCGESR